MIKIKLIVLISFLPIFLSKNDGMDTFEKIIKISNLNDTQSQLLAKIIDENSLRYKISQDIFLSIIKTESNFNQNAISETGDVSIAQINVEIWNKEFRRLGMPLVDKERLKKDMAYSINIMGEILSIIRKRNRKDKHWYARYHSNSKKLKKTYLTKLIAHNKNIYLSKL